MGDSFLDFVRARVTPGHEAEADAILAEHFKGHEQGREMYTKAWDSAQQIVGLMKATAVGEVQAELAKMPPR